MFKSDCLSCGVKFYEFFICFGYQPLIGYIIGEHLLSFSRLSSLFVDVGVFFAVKKLFSLV